MKTFKMVVGLIASAILLAGCIGGLNSLFGVEEYHAPTKPAVTFTKPTVKYTPPKLPTNKVTTRKGTTQRAR